jgi:hypothetical protein
VGRSDQKELKQLTDYQIFILLDSGESISTVYQKITYHIVFDVKYDLIHKRKEVIELLMRGKTYIQELGKWIL